MNVRHVLSTVSLMVFLPLHPVLCVPFGLPAFKGGASWNHPWWKDPNLSKETIDSDFDWDHRDTGISTKQTERYFVEWSHFNSSTLFSNSWSQHQPQPWTQGRLRKQLSGIDNDSFVLTNLFEETAIGHWAGGKQNLQTVNDNGDEVDGDDDVYYYKQEHTFRRTPRRVTRLPVQGLPEHWLSAEAGDSRVTLCGKGVVSGPRWLIPLEEAKTLDKKLSVVADDSSSYLRFDFAEIWLTLDDNRKVGMFVQYDGRTGELAQMFVMRQARVTNKQSNNNNNNNKAFSFDKIQDMLVKEQLWPVLPSPCPHQAFRDKSSIASFVSHQSWKARRAVSVQLASPAGPSVRVETDSVNDFLQITQNNHCRVCFDDGIYCIFPKSMHPNKTKEDVCLEFGCVTDHGLQRIFSCGKRSEGGLHNCVYEEWGPLDDLQG